MTTARHIPPTGRRPCDLMIIGERPGAEEYEQGKPFVGPSGKELWGRVWKVLRLTRADFWVTNLVDTFSVEPPTAKEIAANAKRLRLELLRVRPQVIITVGYHAARALLPQLAGLRGEFFHGLAFPFEYGHLRPRTATLVPCVHSAAALRNPDRYQNQLSFDLMAVKRAIETLIAERTWHRTRRPQCFQVGLVNFGKEGMLLGIDTEGSVAAPECMTLTANDRHVACVEVHSNQKPLKFLRPAIRHAQALAMWNAPHDIQVLAQMGIDGLPRVEDPMLAAYLLGLPQSLKVYAYRELGWEMQEYRDLVDPLDEALVKQTLQSHVEMWRRCHTEAAASADAAAARRADLLRTKKTKKMVAAILKRKLHRTPELPPLKTVNALQRMIDRGAEADPDAEDAS